MPQEDQKKKMESLLQKFQTNTVENNEQMMKDTNETDTAISRLAILQGTNMTIEKMKEDSDEKYSIMNQMEIWEKGSETNANDMVSNKTQEDQNQHEVAKTYQLTTVIAQHVLLMSAKFPHMGYATTTLKKCVDQSINSRNPARRTHRGRRLQC